MLGRIRATPRVRVRRCSMMANSSLSHSRATLISCTGLASTETSCAHSCCFPKAVDLGAGLQDGLMCRTIYSRNREPLSPLGQVSWSSSLRSCRAVWDLEDEAERRRAEVVRDVILRETDFDLLKNS